MVYIKKEWVGTADPLVGESGATPITEEALDHLETQYDEAVAFFNSRISFEHTQDNPLATWTINHALARRPQVTVYVGGEEVIADVVASDTAVTITFAEPQVGTATLN